MPYRFILLSALAALAIIVATPAPAAAQSFALDVHDSIKVLHGEVVVDLKVTITNLDVSPVSIRAIRLKNELPEGATWYSALCFGEMCYPPDVDTPPAANIAPGGTADFKLTVGAESVRPRNDTVRVTVRFDAGPLSDGVIQEFVVISEATSAAPDERTITVRSVRPNPARTSTIIPLEPGDRTAGLSLQIIDALGRTVADLRDLSADADGIRVDVGSLRDGAYFYRLDVDGAARSGRFVVAH